MKCPICKKTTIQAYKPFCCERCRLLDLGRWLKGGYVVPGRDGEAEIPVSDDVDNPS